MLVDIHGHFGQIDAGAVPPARLSMYARVCGIDHVLVSSRDGCAGSASISPVDETDANLACLDACARHAHLVPLYAARPGRPDSNPYAMAGALQSAAFVGAVFAPAATDFDVGEKTIEPYLAALAVIGRPALFCVGDDVRCSPSKIYEQSRRFAQLPVVLCYCGASEPRRAETVALVRQAAERNDANLFLDTSHATTADIRAAIDVLPPERVLLGTDALSYGDSHVPRCIALLDELRQMMPADRFRQLTGENAARLFKLPAQQSRHG